MEKRYQVFVSSTYEDLKEERQKVISILIGLDCFPAAMEFFSASDDDQWSQIKRIIDDCDYYVLITAGMYGSIDPKSGLGYTELEYDYAIKSGRPTISFYRADLTQLTGAKCEKTDVLKAKLESFRAKVKASKMCRAWDTPDGLAAAVAVAIPRLMKERQSAGWIKGDAAADPAKELALRDRIEELDAELLKLRGRPIELIADLAKGIETYTFKLHYSIYRPGGMTRHEKMVTMQWDGIFGMFGRFLINPLPHASAKSDFAKCVGESIYGDVRDAYLTDAEMTTITLQLETLGLIESGDKPGRWTLTPAGKSYLQKIATIKTLKG
jgi:hypothetical protein